MIFIKNPFFWSFISMFGLVGACSVVGTSKVGKNIIYGLIFVAFFDFGRIFLALPFVEQQRFDIGLFNFIIGMPVFVSGIIFAIVPCFSIKPLNSAESEIKLNTNGLYKIVRNPIYLGELLWSLGFSIIFGSYIGIILLPLWWLCLLLLIFIEEEKLEKEIGEKYLLYKNKVKGRIIPGLPI